MVFIMMCGMVSCLTLQKRELSLSMQRAFPASCTWEDVSQKHLFRNPITGPNNLTWPYAMTPDLFRNPIAAKIAGGTSHSGR